MVRCNQVTNLEEIQIFYPKFNQVNNLVELQSYYPEINKVNNLVEIQLKYPEFNHLYNQQVLAFSLSVCHHCAVDKCVTKDPQTVCSNPTWDEFMVDEDRQLVAHPVCTRDDCSVPG